MLKIVLVFGLIISSLFGSLSKKKDVYLNEEIIGYTSFNTQLNGYECFCNKRYLGKLNINNKFFNIELKAIEMVKKSCEAIRWNISLF